MFLWILETEKTISLASFITEGIKCQERFFFFILSKGNSSLGDCTLLSDKNVQSSVDIESFMSKWNEFSFLL